MKKFLILSAFLMSAAFAMAADNNVDMATVLPDQVGAFVNLTINKNSTMSKVIYGGVPAPPFPPVVPNYMSVTGTDNSIIINQIFAGGGTGAQVYNASAAQPSMTVNQLYGFVPQNLYFTNASVLALVIEGRINGGIVLQTHGVSGFFINGVQLDSGVVNGGVGETPPGSLAQWRQTPVMGAQTGIYALSTPPQPLGGTGDRLPAQADPPPPPDDTTGGK